MTRRPIMLMLAAAGLTLAAASAQAGGYGAEGRPIAVLLPPGPCIAAAGQVDRRGGRAVCFVPEVLLPPGPCVNRGGRMVERVGGGRACVIPLSRGHDVKRDPQSGLPTGKRY